MMYWRYMGYGTLVSGGVRHSVYVEFGEHGHDDDFADQVEIWSTQDQLDQAKAEIAGIDDDDEGWRPFDEAPKWVAEAITYTIANPELAMTEDWGDDVLGGDDLLP